jgi:zinc protease
MNQPEPTVIAGDVDGVQAFWPAEPLGTLRAGLLFRVGFVDEPLPKRGISHLVEHLALSAIGQTPYDFNGFVSSTHTSFVAEAPPEGLCGFFTQLCRSLQSIPAPRIPIERQLLRTEAAGRASTTGELLRRLRFGVQAYGAGDLEEFGLAWLTEAELVTWTQDHFVRENAALWLSAPPPTSMRIELPSGAQAPAPRAVPLAQPLPVWTPAGIQGTATSMLGERGLPLMCASWVLQRRLFQRLRIEQGLAYDARSTYQPVDDHLVEVLAFTDGLEDAVPQLRDGVLDVIDELSDVGPTAEEMQLWRAQRDKDLDQLDPLVYVVADARRSMGEPVPTRAETALKQAALQGPEVAAALAAILPTAMMCLPAGHPVSRPGWQQLAERSEGPPVAGKGWAPVKEKSPERLLLGARGISLELPNSDHVTVEWDECAALLTADDGRRVVIGKDGFRILVDPTHWLHSARLPETIDGYVPATLRAGRAEPTAEAGRATARTRRLRRRRTHSVAALPRTDGHVAGLCRTAAGTERIAGGAADRCSARGRHGLHPSSPDPAAQGSQGGTRPQGAAASVRARCRGAHVHRRGRPCYGGPVGAVRTTAGAVGGRTTGTSAVLCLDAAGRDRWLRGAAAPSAARLS